jgi:hypothetical protein
MKKKEKAYIYDYGDYIILKERRLDKGERNAYSVFKVVEPCLKIKDADKLIKKEHKKEKEE